MKEDKYNQCEIKKRELVHELQQQGVPDKIAAIVSGLSQSKITPRR
jgi:hypothetical protein